MIRIAGAVLAIALVAALGCTNGAPSPRAIVAVPRYEAQPTATPAPIAFPRDDGSHDALTEWWYYTGHLDSGDDSYGFEFVIFRSARRGAPTGYASHFAITDRRGKSFAYDQRFRVSVFDTPRDRLDFSVGDWSVAGADGVDRIHASTGRYTLDLNVASRKPPALHGGNGIISFGAAGDSYYYSRTRMEADGTLITDGALQNVRGVAWMDHQWGNFVSTTGGWDWFSFHLDDGADLTGSIVRDDRGATVLTYGTYVDPAGRAVHLGSDDFIVSAFAEWRSLRTGAIYPAAWRIRVPSLDVDLESRPIVSDQELDTRATTGVVYWEGAVEAIGRSRGRLVSGRGYVELTGYADRLNRKPEGATK